MLNNPKQSTTNEKSINRRKCCDVTVKAFPDISFTVPNGLLSGNVVSLILLPLVIS